VQATTTLPAAMDSITTSTEETPAEAATYALYWDRNRASKAGSSNAVMDSVANVTCVDANSTSTPPATVGLAVGGEVGTGGGGGGGGLGGGGDGGGGLGEGGGGEGGWGGGDGGGGEHSPVATATHEAGGGESRGGGLGGGGEGGGGLGGGGEGGGGLGGGGEGGGGLGGGGEGGGGEAGGGVGVAADSTAEPHTLKPVSTIETSLVKDRSVPAETSTPSMPAPEPVNL
jgi:hypothetical protein